MHLKRSEAPVQLQSRRQSRSLRAAPCWFPLLGGRTPWLGLGGSCLALLSIGGAADSWGGTCPAQRSSEDSGIVRKVGARQVASAPGDALRTKDGRSKGMTSCGLPRLGPHVPRPPSVPLPCGLALPPPHPTPPRGLSTRGQCCPALCRGLGENPGAALPDLALGWGRGRQLKYRTPS